MRGKAMKKANHILRAALAAAAIAGTVAVSALPVVAVAQDVKPPKLDAKVQKALAAAQEAIQAKDWATALTNIDTARAVEGKGPYDEFMINELSYFAQINQKQYAEAATSLEASLKSGYVPAADVPQRHKVLCQLYFQTENYPKAVEYGNQFLQSAPSDQTVGDLVARGYYLQKDYANARTAAKKVVDASAKPGEAILQVLLASNLELDDRPGVFSTLEMLVKHYPQPKYWNDLLNNQLFASKTDRELRSLYRLMEDTNTLDKGEEYTEMATALVGGGFPSEAKRVLEKGMSAGLISGDAKTRAEQELERARSGAESDRKELAGADAALGKAKTGNDMVALGKLYFSTGEYAKAADAIQKGLTKGGVSDADDANTLLGIALARSAKPAEAVQAFQAIKDPRLAELGRLWQLAVQAPAPAQAAAPPTTGG
jgi:tetratricopeptide (TPR) repeat protein